MHRLSRLPLIVALAFFSSTSLGCSSDGGRGLEEGQCLTDDQCPAQAGTHAICQYGRCVPGCQADTHCLPYVCISFQCKTSCAGPLDCARGNDCVDGVCQLRSCTGTGQCDGAVCKDGRCVQECEQSGCEPGYTCYAGVCVCEPGACGRLLCVGGRCPTSCGDDADCDHGSRCREGRCVGCTGTAWTCPNQKDCTGTPGCIEGETCTGGALGCASLTPAKCRRAAGCTLDTTSTKCSGTAMCEGQNIADCNYLGCVWRVGCSGTPNPCSSLDAASCTHTAGCSVE